LQEATSPALQREDSSEPTFEEALSLEEELSLEGVKPAALTILKKIRVATEFCVLYEAGVLCCAFDPFLQTSHNAYPSELQHFWTWKILLDMHKTAEKIFPKLCEMNK